jgi:2-dehydro-3-deoxy-D-gluconate 5-dehydrogenase
VSKLFDLSGKVAIVTGPNTGLGQAMSIALAEAGAKIALVGRVEPDETVKIIEAAGGTCITIMADLSSTDVIPGIISQAVDGLGPIDILVNNAGIIRREDSVDFSEKDWDDVMAVNLRTPFFLAQAVARTMIDEGRPGKIINTASLLSYQGGIRVPSYTASKSGIAGITRLLANEWAAKGINVNAIVPGYFATDNTRDLRADASRSQEILARIPAGRWGEPSDLGGAAVFLASSAADYIHGALIPVDGGWLAR